MKKILKNNLIGFILGGLIFGSIGVYAATLYNSEQVTYEGANGTTNVKEALDDLYGNLFNSNNTKIVDLGTISETTSFTLSDYGLGDVTDESNFIFVATGITTTGGITGAVFTSNSVHNSIASFSISNGILTVIPAAANMTAKYQYVSGGYVYNPTITAYEIGKVYYIENIN